MVPEDSKSLSACFGMAPSGYDRRKEEYKAAFVVCGGVVCYLKEKKKKTSDKHIHYWRSLISVLLAAQKCL